MFAGSSTSSSSSEQPDGTIVYATASGISVTADDWNALIKASPEWAGSKVHSADEATSLVQDAMVSLLAERLLIQRLNNEFAGESERIAAIGEDAVRNAMAEWIRLRKMPTLCQPTEQEIDEQFKRRQNELKRPDRLDLRQIYLNTRGLGDEAANAKKLLAEQIAERLQNDPGLFRSEALKYSESSSEPRDLLIENVRPDGVLRELRETLWQLQEGQVSKPIKSPAGWHIFKVEKRRSGGIPTAEAREAIGKEIAASKVDLRIEELVARAREDYGLILHAPPAKLQAETQIVSGSASLNGARLASARGTDLADAPVGAELAGLFRMIQQQYVLLAFARQMQWDADPAYKREESLARITALRNFYASRRLEIAGGISPDAIEGYYRDHAADFTIKSRYKVREMRLIPNANAGAGGDRVPAKELYEKALHYSEAAKNGQSLEVLIRGEPMAVKGQSGGLVRVISQPELASAYACVQPLGVGEVSAPIRLNNGYSLVQVLDIEKNVLPPLEELRESIRIRLEEAWKQELWNEFDQQIRREAHWTIPRNIIGQFVKG